MLSGQTLGVAALKRLARRAAPFALVGGAILLGAVRIDHSGIRAHSPSASAKRAPAAAAIAAVSGR